MKKQLKVNDANCPQNHVCPAVKACPVGALTQIGYSAPTVDYEKCVACGRCAAVCPKRALTLAD